MNGAGAIISARLATLHSLSWTEEGCAVGKQAEEAQTLSSDWEAEYSLSHGDEDVSATSSCCCQSSQSQNKEKKVGSAADILDNWFI